MSNDGANAKFADKGGSDDWDENKRAWADVLEQNGIPRKNSALLLGQVDNLQMLIDRLKGLPKFQHCVKSWIKALVDDQRRRLLLQVMTASPDAGRYQRCVEKRLILKLRQQKPETAQQMANDVLDQLKSKAGCHDRMLDIVRDCMHMLSCILKPFT